MLHAAHHHAHPVVGLVNDAGRGVQQVIFREQPVDVVNAVAQSVHLTVLNAGICKSGLHGAAGLGGLHHLVDLVDAVLQHGALRVLLKYVPLHGFFLLIVSLFAVTLFQGHAHQCVAALLLFGCHAVVHLFQRLAALLFVRPLGFLLCCFVGRCIAAVYKVVQRFAVRVQSMGNAQAAVCVDECFAALVVLVSTVLHHLVDQRTRVTACQHKAHFLNNAVLDSVARLLDAVCIDGKSVQVAIFHAGLRGPAGIRIVELCVAVHAPGPVLQQAVAKNVFQVVMVMVVHHGHNFTVAFLERIRCNGQAIIALGLSLRGPSAAVVIKLRHFDLPYSFLRLPFQP